MKEEEKEEGNMGVTLLGSATGVDGPQCFQDIAAAVDECDSDDHEDPYRHIDIDPGDEDHIDKDEDRSIFGMDAFDDDIGIMVNVNADDEKLTEIDELELEDCGAHPELEEWEKFGKRKRLEKEDDDDDLRRPNKYAKTASARPTRASTTTRRGTIGRAGARLLYKRTPSDDLFAASLSSAAFGSASAAALESVSPSTSAAATASTSFPSTTATAATATAFSCTSADTSTATTTTTSPAKRRKRSAMRKGWKGWVEVDGSEERIPPRQFRLEILSPGARRTRSGRQFGR